MLRQLITVLLGIRGDFQKLFIINEFDELTGKSRSSIITLSVILIITFLALGFSIGGINYLRVKMDDPYTNWVNLTVKQGYEEKVKQIQIEFDDDSLRTQYQLKNVSGYKRVYKAFPKADGTGNLKKTIRSIDIDGDLIKEILKRSRKNVVSGYVYDEGEDFDIPTCGIIIKESSLASLGYENFEGLTRIPVYVEESGDSEGGILIYPEVISVVEELPNLVDAVVSSHFLNLLELPYDVTNFFSTSSSNRLELVSINPLTDSDVNKITDNLFDFSVQDSELDDYELSDDTKLQRLTLYFGDYYDYETQDTMLQLLSDIPMLSVDKFIDWECNVGDFSKIEDPFYLSFNFDKLDEVRNMKDYLVAKHDVIISMDQVEQKENFVLVSRLTNAISFILFGFSILSIIFYINSLLRTHLEKIKMNLGTLKAFGLNNKFLVNSYLKIIFAFIAIAVAIGFIVCIAWDFIDAQIMTNSYFDIFHWKIVMAVIIIFVTGLITSQRTITKTLEKTPGDLIYNR